MSTTQNNPSPDGQQNNPPPPNFDSEPWYKKAQAEIIGGMTVLLIAGAATFLYNLNNNVSKVMEQIEAVNQIVDIKDRLAHLEMKGTGGGAYAQLSSAQDQFYDDGQMHLVRMELRDAVYEIKFDPRISNTEITCIKPGNYLLIAAPQVGFKEDVLTSVDFWMVLNGKNVNNSNVRVANTSSKYTDVVVLQAVFPMAANDVLSIGMSSTGGMGGIDAISVDGEPLIPSIIFSLLYLGEKH